LLRLKPCHKRVVDISGLIDATYDVSGSDGSLSGDQVLDGYFVTEKFKRFFQTGKVLGTDQYRSRSTVASNDDALVFAGDAIDKLGESILNVSQRVCRHGHNCAQRLEGSNLQEELRVLTSVSEGRLEEECATRVQV